MRLLRDQSGLVGKIILVWLIVVGLLGVAAIDGTSIVLTHFRLSDAAGVAAVAGANDYANHHDATAACEAAQRSIEVEAPGVRTGKNTCVVNRSDGTVTVVLKQEARTIVAGLLPFTKDYTKISVKETASPGAL
jgi:hypothetical protein